jgi:hypothetical protein
VYDFLKHTAKSKKNINNLTEQKDPNILQK